MDLALPQSGVGSCALADTTSTRAAKQDPLSVSAPVAHLAWNKFARMCLPRDSARSSCAVWRVGRIIRAMFADATYRRRMPRTATGTP